MKQGTTLKEAAEDIGTTPKWIRRQIKAGVVDPKRAGTKRNSRFVLTDRDVEALQERWHTDGGADPSPVENTALARIAQLESDRADLLAQVAWTRAIAQEQQKGLEAEQRRTEKLETELQIQRARIEQLKALSAFDRLRGRHKAI